jgi:hypothetical protein
VIRVGSPVFDLPILGPAPIVWHVAIGLQGLLDGGTAYRLPTRPVGAASGRLTQIPCAQD